MGFLETVFIIMVTLLGAFWTAFACAFIADARYRNKTNWFLLGLLGVIPLIVLLMLPAKEPYYVEHTRMSFWRRNRSMLVFVASYTGVIVALLCYFLFSMALSDKA